VKDEYSGSLRGDGAGALLSCSGWPVSRLRGAGRSFRGVGVAGWSDIRRISPRGASLTAVEADVHRYRRRGTAGSKGPQ
jgi:hypothetical protein